MNVLRRCGGICVLAVALALVLGGAGWSQTPTSTTPEYANLYRQAVSLLEQAQEQLTAVNLAGALAMVKQSNELFTRLQKECSTFTGGAPSFPPRTTQQLAINQKLAADAQAEADRLLAAAAAKKKQAEELDAQGKAEHAAEPIYPGVQRKDTARSQNLLHQVGNLRLAQSADNL